MVKEGGLEKGQKEKSKRKRKRARERLKVISRCLAVKVFRVFPVESKCVHSTINPEQAVYYLLY